MSKAAAGRGVYNTIFWLLAAGGLYALHPMFPAVNVFIYNRIGPFSIVLYILAGIALFIFLTYLRIAISSSVMAIYEAMTYRRAIRYDGSHAQTTLYRTARKLEKRKDFIGAGEVYETLEMWEQAAHCFEQAGHLSRAAACHEKAGDVMRAIELFEQEENYEMAANKATAEGLRERALTNYKSAAEKAYEENSFGRAAEYFERAHDYDRAARVFETLQRKEDTLRCYEKAGNSAKIEQILKDMPVTEIGKRAPISIEVIRRAVEHLVRNGNLVEAASALDKAGDSIRAAEIYEKAEDYERAGEIYFQIGQVERAKAAYSKVPDEVKVSDFLARLAQQEGDWKTAGEKFELAQKPNQAIEMYKRAKDFIGAAAVYDKLNRHLMAGEMYSAAKDFSKAAESYAKGHDWRNAADCYISTGDLQMAANAFVEAGNYFRAGTLAIQLEDYAKATEYLQRVSPTSPDAKLATGYLGVAFFHLNRPDMAYDLFKRVIDQVTPSIDTLPILYFYGRTIENDNPEEAIAIYQRIMGVSVAYKDVPDRLQKVQDATVLHTSDSRVGSGIHMPNVTAAGKTVLTSGATETMERHSPPPTQSPETRFGEEGRYRILQELGRGGMAIVYKALDQHLEREVALKTFPLSRSSGPGKEDVFLQEARLVARLSHPNIVTIYDSGHMNYLYYIAMEYVPGENMKQVVKRKGPLSLEDVRVVFRQLADALVYAHSQQILHRDIKPGNVIMHENGNVKVVDFGLAKILVDAATEATEREDSQRTLVGTPQYMAPEQILGHSIDARTDIYALGLTLFYAITGRTPFDVRKINDPLEISRMQLHSSFPRPSTLRATLPPKIDDIFIRCTQKNPDDRYGSAVEFLDEFNLV